MSYEGSRHERVSQLFGLACDLPEQQRRSFVLEEAEGDAELARDVLALLEFDAPESEPAIRMPAGAPESIGGYRILEVLGSGGMGVVYRALQETPLREVALKVLLPGTDVGRLGPRLEREAELLGRLTHPGIARIYQSGSADTAHGPCPFFAMELIAGSPITEYFDSRPSSLRDVARALVRLCLAVEHAHAHGVIHRDLKPGNVFVDESGEPRVLDFGVARPSVVDRDTPQLTQEGTLIGTLAYMSPEQARFGADEVDERCDVYSIGAMAFELFTGRVPLDLSRLPLAEAVKRLVEEDPLPIGAFGRELGGDLEVIVGKALAKEPNRRYASAAALRKDLQRWLDHEPVEARAPSTLYRISRFVRRNRVLVGATSAVVIASLAAAAVSMRAARVERDAAQTAFNARGEANAERARAERALARASAVSELLKSAIEGADPDEAMVASVGDATIADMLGGLVAELDDAPPADAAVELEARLALARSYKGLGDYERAMEQLVSAKGRLAQLAPGDADLADSVLAEEAVALGRLGRHEEAARALEALLERRTSLGDSPAKLVPMLGDLAWAQFEAGHLDEAEATSHRALDLARVHRAGDEGLFGSLTLNLGMVLGRKGRLSEARTHYAEALAAFDRVYPYAHPRPAAAANNLGWTDHKLGDNELAEAELREAVDRFRGAYAKPHPRRADYENNLALVLNAQGKTEEALRVLGEALSAYRATRGEGHPETEKALVGMGALLGLLERGREAADVYTTHADLLEDLDGAETERVLLARIESARLLGKDESSREEAEGALLALADRVNESEGAAQALRDALVGFYQAWGRDEDAAAWRERDLQGQ